jgi:hypothetical protein
MISHISINIHLAAAHQPLTEYLIPQAAHPINASDGSSDPTIDNNDVANSKAFCVTSRGEVAVEKDTSRLKNYCAEQKTQEQLRKAMQNAQREAGKKEETISLEAGQVAAGLENNSALKTGEGIISST